VVGDTQAAHIGNQRRGVEGVRLRVHCRAGDLELYGGAALQGQQDVQQGQGVLAARQAQQDAVSLLDHAPLLHRLAHLLHNLLGWHVAQGAGLTALGSRGPTTPLWGSTGGERQVSHSRSTDDFAGVSCFTLRKRCKLYAQYV
jgi:hypothetical protein